MQQKRDSSEFRTWEQKKQASRRLTLMDEIKLMLPSLTMCQLENFKQTLEQMDTVLNTNRNHCGLKFLNNGSEKV